jgi:predicted O-methyltransferase YrrM
MKPYSIQQFLADVHLPENIHAVIQTHASLTRDRLLEAWAANLAERYRQRRPYWDLACALRQIAAGTEARAYLEIGTRKGKSMAMVARERPEATIYGFDLWMSPYSGDDNPGPDFVRAEMARVGYRGALEFFDGDSAVTLPAFRARHPELRFDLITVDGDHSDEGAWGDLTAAVALLAPGGFLVFDDLLHPAHTLLGVWRTFQETHGELLEFVENLEDHNGTGVARRRG